MHSSSHHARNSSTFSTNSFIDPFNPSTPQAGGLVSPNNAFSSSGGGGGQANFNFGMNANAAPTGARGNAFPSSHHRQLSNGTGLKDLNISQLSQMSVPQLAQLQQQLSAMSQLSQQQQSLLNQQNQQLQQQIQANDPHIKQEFPFARHGRNPSNNQQQILQHKLHQLQPSQQQQNFNQFQSPLSPNHHMQHHALQQQQQQQMMNNISPIHSQISPGQFSHHSHGSTVMPATALLPNQFSPYGNMVHPAITAAASPSTATPSSRASLSSASSRRNSRSTIAAANASGSSSSMSPFPTISLKLKRKLRKNNREKQRRGEINEQFDILCHMLSLGPVSSAAAAAADANDAAVAAGTQVPPTVPTVGSTNIGPGGSATSSSKVEKFTILSEACHTIAQLRLELRVYKGEKAENRAEMEKLAASLDQLLKSTGSQITGEEFVRRFFPNLQRPDFVLPPSKAAQPKSTSADSDEELAEEGEHSNDASQMGEKDGQLSELDMSRAGTGVSDIEPIVSAAPAKRSSRAHSSAHATATAAAAAAASAYARAQAVQVSSAASSSVTTPYSLSSPPSLPSPTHPTYTGYVGTSGANSNAVMDSSMVGGVVNNTGSTQPSSSSPYIVGSAGRSSPSLAALLSGASNSSHHPPRPGSGLGRANMEGPGRVAEGGRSSRGHSRSNSSSALPRFGSNDFSSPQSMLPSTKATHSRQASHARSRSLQGLLAQQAAQVKEEEDAAAAMAADKPTLEMRGHSRNGSNSIPPPPSIPGIQASNSLTSQRSLHSSGNSMDLGFGPPSFNFFPGSKPAGAPNSGLRGHARAPSGSNSSVFLNQSALHGLAMDLASGGGVGGVGSLSSPPPHLHQRNRSTASIGGSNEMLFNANIAMEDADDLNVFDSTGFQ